MRLIDADKVIEVMRNEYDMQKFYLLGNVKKFVIDEMPTVIDMNKVITLLECMARREAKEACEARKNGDNYKVAQCDGAVEAYEAAKELIKNEIAIEHEMWALMEKTGEKK